MSRQTPNARRLELSRLDDRFEELRSNDGLLFSRPTRGWVNTIRKALGMSAVQLAKRLGVSRDALYQLEKREVSHSVTLKQLDKAAAALDCEVVYALVPRKSLEQTIRAQARAKVEAQLRRANISMGLEAEGVRDEDFSKSVGSAVSYSEALGDRLLWDD